MEPQEISALRAEVAKMAQLTQRLETALAGDGLSPIGLIHRVNVLEQQTAKGDRFRNWLTGGISAVTSTVAVGIFLAVFNHNLNHPPAPPPQPTATERREMPRPARTTNH